MKIVKKHIIRVMFFTFIFFVLYSPNADAATWGDISRAGGKALALRYDAGYKPHVIVSDIVDSKILSEDDLKEHLTFELRRKIGKNLSTLSDNTWIDTGKKVETDLVVYISVKGGPYNEHSPIYHVSLRLYTVRRSGHTDYSIEKDIMAHSNKLDDYVKEAISELAEDFSKTYFNSIDFDFANLFNSNEPAILLFTSGLLSEFLEVPILTNNHLDDLLIIRSRYMQDVYEACKIFYSKALPVLLKNIALPPDDIAGSLVCLDNVCGGFIGLNLQEIFYREKRYIVKEASKRYFFIEDTSLFGHPIDYNFLKSEMKKRKTTYIDVGEWLNFINNK